MGYDISHERLRKDGISSWYLVSDQKEVPLGPTYKQIKKLNLILVHQIRHPLMAISSMQAMGKPSWKFLSNEIPINIGKDSKILMAMKYWYYWNLKAEKKANISYSVENIDSVLPELLSNANFSSSIKNEIVTNRKTNTRKHSNLNWSDLEREDYELTQKIKKMGIKYGYKVN